ncbi:MAG: DUF4430 domain-containing protein [Oscillospiraceae bacterium]|nr:DUF4430 domain-containing protein [Oscillospiraceae bacterium]
MKKRILSLLLALTLTLGLLPGAAWAGDGGAQPLPDETAAPAETMPEADTSAPAEDAPGEAEPAPTADGTEKPASPEIASEAGGLGKSHTIYSDDKMPAMSVKLVKNGGYEAVKATVQQATAADGPYADTATSLKLNKVHLAGNMQASLTSEKPNTAGTYYFRVKLVHTKGGQESEPTYTSSVMTVNVRSGQRPAMVVQKPHLLGENNSVGAEVTEKITLVLPSEELPRRVQYGQFHSSIVRIDKAGNDGTTNWDLDKYTFAGWQINGAFYPADTTATITAETTVPTGGTWADYYSSSDWKLSVYNDLSRGSYEIGYSDNYSGVHEVLKDFDVYPLFKEEQIQFTPTLVETTGGTVSRLHKTGETHTLTAVPAERYAFDHWEQSADGTNWTKIEGAEAVTEVTLTANTSYRAIFKQLKLEKVEVGSYALPAQGDDWQLNLKATLNMQLTNDAAFQISVYEGADNSGKKLGDATINIWATEDWPEGPEIELKAKLTSRPSSNTAQIYAVVTLPAGAQAAAGYTLKGTLDVTPASVVKSSVEDLFFQGKAVGTYTLSATGDPAPQSITWSGGNETSVPSGTALGKTYIDPSTGVVSYTRGYVDADAQFVADAGDGRVAMSSLTVKKHMRAIRLKDAPPKLVEGQSAECEIEYNEPHTKASLVTLTSSDESIFTAKTVANADGNIKSIELTGVGAGTAALTIQTGGADAPAKTYSITVADPATAIIGVTVAPKTAEVQTGETVQLSAVITPENAVGTVQYLSGTPAVASVDERGLVTGIAAGTAVITATARDASGNTVRDTCEITVRDDPYSVKVYVPKATVGSITFTATAGFDADNRDIPGSALKANKDTETDTAYDIYTMELKEGVYSFRATDPSGKSLGGGAFRVPAEATGGWQGGGTQSRGETKVHLRVTEWYVKNEYDGQKASTSDYTVKVLNKLGTVTVGEPYTNAAGYECYPALSYVNGNALLYYCTATPSEAYAAAHNVGARTFSNLAITTGTEPYASDITLNEVQTFTINAPAGTTAAVFQQTLNFNTERIAPTSTETQADGTVDYIFRVTPSSNLTWRASMEGKRTQAGYYQKTFAGAESKSNRVVVDFGDGAPDWQDTSGLGLAESSLLLNVNERNKLDLTVGESYKLRAYRAAWQITNNDSSNILIEPDFHYNILSGSDVISLTPTISGNQNSGDNCAWITAKKAGVAVVEVTYDAIDVKNHSWEQSIPTFGACDPRRTGVFVVTVGSGYGNVAELNWDCEHDMVYFTEDAGKWTVAPVGDQVTVSVATVYKGVLGEWQSVAGSNGSYQVPIASGNNLVRVTANGVTDYQVVRGSKLEAVITNLTGEASGRTEVHPGDQLKIGFKGLYNPVPKFAGIYNTYPRSFAYRLGEMPVASTQGQYDMIVQTMTVTVPDDAAGSITLTKGVIENSAFGSKWGAHRQLTDVGVPANFNASIIDMKDVPLPDITIPVARLSSDEAKQEAKKTVTDAYGKYQSSNYTAENWAKIGEIKAKALQDIDAAETLSAVTEIKNTALSAMAAIARIPAQKPVDPAGIHKTHTRSYYKTTGLTFDVADPAGYVTVSFVDYGERLNDADFETPLGLLVDTTRVPFKAGDSIADVTVRLLDALGIQYSYTGEVDNGFYLASIKNFKLSDGTVVESFGECDSGAGSGWMITSNNWFINRSAAEFEVEDGDVIKWQNTCQLGKDIGCDWANPSAKITGFRFQRNYGTLSPAFSDSVQDYIYTIPASVQTISLEAEMANYWSILTCTSEGTSYKPMQAIPVKNGTVITFTSSFAEYAGDPASDTDTRTITIQVSGEAAVTTPSTQKPVKPAVSVTVKPEATVNASGEAQATVSEKDLNTTIDQAKTEKADKIVIEPEITGDASKVSVELPKSAVGGIVQDTGAALSVKTGVGTVTIPQKSLEELSKHAGSKVTLSAEALKSADGKPSGQTRIEIAVDGKAVEKLSGGVTVAVPAKTAGSGSVLVLVQADGTEKVIKKSALDGEALAGIVDGSCTVRVVDNAKPFADTENHWAKDAVAFASSHELFSGTGADTFAPNAPMNRAMLATVLFRLEDAKADGKADFADVAGGAWYADSVAWASQAGIVSGTGNGFDPNGNVTREQLATMLYRYARTLGMDVAAQGDLGRFADGGKTSAWARDAMGWAVGSGLISGKGNGSVDPAGSATRAEVAAIMQRMVKLMVR